MHRHAARGPSLLGLLLVTACGCGSSGRTTETGEAEPAWLVERAREVEPDAYAAAVAAQIRPSRPEWAFAVETEGTCGGDHVGLRYRVVEDLLAVEVAAAGALDTAPVELRLGGRVAFHDASRWEEVNTITGDSPHPAPFEVEHASTFLPQGAASAMQFTVAWAHRQSYGFVWGKRRTLTGPTLRLQRPTAALLARIAAWPAEAARLTAEEEVLSDIGSNLGALARSAERFKGPAARRIADGYQQLRTDLDRRQAAFTAEFAKDRPEFAAILALDTTACR